MSAAMMLASCGGTKDAGKTDQALIGKSDRRKADDSRSALGDGTYRRTGRIA